MADGAGAWTKLYLDLSAPQTRADEQPPAPAPGASPPRPQKTQLFRNRHPTRGPPRPPRPPSSRRRRGNFVDHAARRAGHEITGPLAAQLWARPEDMDLFLTLRNRPSNDMLEIRRRGHRCPWLRAGSGFFTSRAQPRIVASLSPLPQASAAAMAHAERNRQGAGGDLVDLDGVQRGHRIRLDIQPHDGIGSAPYTAPTTPTTMSGRTRSIPAGAIGNRSCSSRSLRRNKARRSATNTGGGDGESDQRRIRPARRRWPLPSASRFEARQSSQPSRFRPSRPSSTCTPTCSCQR